MTHVHISCIGCLLWEFLGEISLQTYSPHSHDELGEVCLSVIGAQFLCMLDQPCAHSFPCFREMVSALVQTSQLSCGSMEGTFPAQQGWWELISLKVYLFSINLLPLFPFPLGLLNPSRVPTSVIAMLHPWFSAENCSRALKMLGVCELVSDNRKGKSSWG